MVIFPISPFRATGKDWNWDGFHQRRHANSGESSQGNGIVLWNFPQVLEKVSLSSWCYSGILKLKIALLLLQRNGIQRRRCYLEKWRRRRCWRWWTTTSRHGSNGPNRRLCRKVRLCTTTLLLLWCFPHFTCLFFSLETISAVHGFARIPRTWFLERAKGIPFWFHMLSSKVF